MNLWELPLLEGESTDPTVAVSSAFDDVPADSLCNAGFASLY